MLTATRRAVLGLPLAVLAGCAADAVPPAEFDGAAAQEQARRPEFYTNGEARAFLVARDGADRGTLWGTYHARYDETTVLPRPMRDRFAAAKRLYVESVLDRLSPSLRRALADERRRGLLTSDAAALAALDPATHQALDDAGVTAEERGKYSLLGLSMVVANRAQADLQGPLPGTGIVDVNLMGFARSVSIPVLGLEGISAAGFRELLFVEPNGPAGAAVLRLALRRRAGQRGLAAWARARYAAGTTAALTAGMVAWRAEPADLARWDRQRGPLLTQRNQAWLPRLEAALGESGPTFAAFGCAHLLGTDGVVALLRSRGWTVQPCVGDRVPGV